jgi:hypothetical protein
MRMLDGSDSTISSLGVSPSDALKSQAAVLENAAGSIDATTFTEALQKVETDRSDLEARMAVRRHRAEIEKEIARLSQRSLIESGKRRTDTSTITRKASELTEAHVTALVRDRFTRESDRLRLERIELKKTGGQKGKLRHRPALLGAKTPKPVVQILSEGEQTALGLAGYFTEAHFDASKSALVLDDPVTSLDHYRRAYVANRLAQFAADRQVIVFTHDLTFVGDLSAAAEHEGVTFAERCIERRGDKTPGLCRDEYPWKAKGVGRRFNELDELLAEIKRSRVQWTQEEYEKECADWAGKLSETWERLISLEVVYPLVTPGASHVQPRMFRVLARITDVDDREFQESYARCSLWARRHDKSQATNYVPPEPDELARELESVRTWFSRVKKYSN